MSDARGGAERRAWTRALGLLAAIYLSLYPLPFLLEFLRARNLLRLSVAVLFGAAALAAVAWALRRRAEWREWAVLAAAALVYAYLLSRMTVLQERLHLLEYGVVALALRAAFAARFAGRRGDSRAPGLATGAAALGATVAAGWLDEGIQALLPNRYYDVRDVGFNALAGALALGVEAALEAARRRGAGAHDAARPADFL
jgi:hypothetical protein